MPPSGEGLSKPTFPNRAQRRATTRKPDSKLPGSEGKHLAQVQDPDEVVTHSPTACRNCREDLANAQLADTERRQVFELPPMRAFCPSMERRRCHCGCLTKAEAPDDATAPGCYGPGVRALAVYLAIYQHLPYDRLAELFGDVVGISVSVGALAQMANEAGGGLGLLTEAVTELLADAPLVHFENNETGARVASRLHWVHVASSSLGTLLMVHQRRGSVAINEMGVMARMTGVACHDGWRPYLLRRGSPAVQRAPDASSSRQSPTCTIRTGPTK
jgi:transposase